MAVYQEILEQIATLSKKEQNLLLQELKNRLDDSLDEDNDFSDEDLIESELEWQNYINKKDLGKSLQQIELELLGENIE